MKKLQFLLTEKISVNFDYCQHLFKKTLNSQYHEFCEEIYKSIFRKWPRDFIP